MPSAAQPATGPAASQVPLSGPPLQRILVCTDLSQSAHRAMLRATLLPLAPDAIIELLHVAPDEGAVANARVLAVRIQRRLTGEARVLRDTLAGRDRSGVEVTTTMGNGQAYQEILRRALAARPDLIVVGRHGQGGLKSLLVGSTAERVVRGRVAPVLVVTRDARGPYRRPLVAVDAGEPFTRLLDYTWRLLASDVPRVELTAAYQVAYEGWMKAGNVPTPSLQRMREEVASRYKKALATALPRQAGVRLVTTVKRGDPRGVVPALAATRGSDLVAVGTHARRGLARFLLGSVAAEILRATTDSDVLVVPPPRGG